MTATSTPGPLHPGISLFEHALRLHRQDPHSPLHRDGWPCPDEPAHRGQGRPRPPVDHRRNGADVAAVLDRYFSTPEAPPSALVDAFHDLDVPIHRNDHVAAAALRADRQRVRRTGRWLVRHSTDRCSATVGLALLAGDWDKRDVPLIQTIGLLSYQFGPLAAEALRRRGDGPALVWLAQRVAGWGRVYVVEALCRLGAPGSRQWLLRHACDGDHLNGYFAGEVATAAHLHEAITHADADDELTDHTGRLLRIMSGCGGMGATLEDYPPAPAVLAAHVARLARQEPTASRYVEAALLADGLAEQPPERSGCSREQRDDLVRQYHAVLDRPGWCAAVREGLDPGNDFFAWFTGQVAVRRQLRAFSDLPVVADDPGQEPGTAS